MRIITNADDFGQDESAVRGTIECFENGSLTSATIMVNMPATAMAVEYAKRNPRFSFGVHLTYVLGVGNESPVADAKLLPTLCGADGLFRVSNRTRIRAMLRRVSVDEIARETEAQVALLREMGVPISHVDSHGHMHRYGVFQEALKRVLPRFGIRKVRSVQDVYLKPLRRSPNYWLGPLWRKALRERFQTTDHFYMPTSAWDHNWWGPLLDRVKGNTMEVGVHPGTAEDWRIEERTSLPEFAHEARRRGHTLIGWAQL